MNADSIKSYLYVLTSDSLQGRETGQAGQRKAADFIAGKFFQFGLQPETQDTFQIHPLSAKANKEKNLVIGNEKLVFYKDYFTRKSTRDTVLAFDQLQLVGTNHESRKIHTPPGAVLLLYGAVHPHLFHKKPIHSKLERTPTLQSIVNKFASDFPAALLIAIDSVSMNIDSLSRLVASLNESASPVFWVTTEALRRSGKKLDKILSGSKRRVHATTISTTVRVPYVSDPRTLLGKNVPFLIKGTTQNSELVSVTAHYDHLGLHNDTIFYGADDNASGTATVLELARVFALAVKSGYSPTRNILFMPVSGEEKGLLGSRYYSSHPLFPMEQTVAEVNIDMVGRVDPEHDSLGVKDYIYVIGSDKLSSQLHEINESANKRFAHLELDYRYNRPGEPNRFYFRSDHYNFAKHGVPSIFYFNGKHADYHRSTDTPDKIDSELIRKRAVLIFHTIWELANRPDRITVDRKNDME